VNNAARPEKFGRTPLVMMIWATVTAVLWLACTSPPVVIPTACVGDDSVYHLVRADTARGFHLASPIFAIFPTSPVQGRGKVRFIVDERGVVDTTSIMIDSASSNQYASEIAAAAAKTKFMPATRLGCAVKSWSGMGFVTCARGTRC
jgi:hypothetical protein